MKKRLAQAFYVLTALSLPFGSASAFEEHEAHEHGHATLMLVQEKDELQMVFKSPAMNIVGFEHQPNTDEQRAKVEAAVKQLKDVDNLFTINEIAKCELEHARVKSALLEAVERHDHHEHGNHQDDTHSEFQAEYHFECANMDGLKELKLKLFDFFSSLEEVEAQLILKSEQRLEELNHHNASIKF